MTAIGRHFQLEEFLSSQTATRAGHDIELPPELLPNLTRLVLTCLDPIRDLVGKPIVISSGYRPPWLNLEIGGARTSAHVDARAADFTCPGMTNMELARLVVASGIPFDQCILEFPPRGWIHVGIAPLGVAVRGDQLTAMAGTGGTRYASGFTDNTRINA